jgi:uncharacterized protein YyaL (SSP411 family)
MEAGKESEAQDIKKMTIHALDYMARSGFHEHVRGGFHIVWISVGMVSWL